MNRVEQYIRDFGLEAFKMLCYDYAAKHTYACVLDSCQLNTGVRGGRYEFIAGFGAQKVFTQLEHLNTADGSWKLGIISYDLKNKFESLSSENTAHIITPELLFFEPEVLLCIEKNGKVSLLKGSMEASFFEQQQQINNDYLLDLETFSDKQSYIEKIGEIHKLIREGQVYELNYCLPFVQRYEQFSPIDFHKKLIKASPVPMASYLRANHLHLCGASMERYLCKQGNRLISQPIKGTIRKGNNPQEDAELIRQLETSEKERAENVMIVDLVRNDLARICEAGTIEVEELFGIYSYLQVHQMISTVTGSVLPDVSFGQIIEASFPMGSMTGAPKISAMEEIEKLESFRRGWYSGAVGYVQPNGDFDFNVVIRSLVCDTIEQKLMYCAGGAITIDSVPESEWDEVKLKTKAISTLLGN